LFEDPTYVNFSARVNITQTDGTSYNFSRSNSQLIIYQSILACDDSTHIHPVWNVSFFDIVSNAAIDPTASYDLSYTDGTITKSISGGFTPAHNVSFCSNLDPTNSVFNWDIYGSLTASKENYVNNVLTIDEGDSYAVNNSKALETSIYMITLGNSSTITYTWLTTEYQSIDGIMKVYQCNGTGDKILVESTPITSGQAVANLQLLTQTYSYEVVIDGVTYTGISFTPCHIESSTTRTYYVDIGAANYTSGIALQGVFCNISKTGSDTVKMSWNDNPADSSEITGCILAYRSGISGYTLIYQNCTNASNSIERSIPMNSFDYLIKGSLTQGDTSKWCDNTVEFKQDNDTATQFGISGVFVIVLLILSMALFYHAGGEVQLALAGVGLIGAWVLGITQFGWVTISAVLAFLIIIALIGRHSRK
jgi:hypothetical protein